MQFTSTPVELHPDVQLPDDGRLEAITTRWTPSDGEAACFVVSAGPSLDREPQLAEITGLAEAHGSRVVGTAILRLDRPHPKTWFGAGQCERLAASAQEVGATMLVVDAQLSPSQTRNLEDATGLHVADREVIILGVFLRNARSKRSRIQVEIAHLEFLRPRIRGLGLDMDQQAGGVMNGKGAGETASELLARQLDGRLVQLRRQAERLDRSATLRRQRSEGVPRVALVGYTNAGKTSLMNALTGSELSARTRPFETLDTTTRALTRHGGDVLLGDTVGFIRDLPERLLPSFASTLVDALDASLLALVLDASDPEWPLHLRTTEEVLDQVGGGDIPRLLVFNKCDAADVLPDVDRDHVHVSALDADSVAMLRERLIDLARTDTVETWLDLPYDQPERHRAVYRDCVVLESHAGETSLRVKVRGAAAVVGKLHGVA